MLNCMNLVLHLERNNVKPGFTWCFDLKIEENSGRRIVLFVFLIINFIFYSLYFILFFLYLFSFLNVPSIFFYKKSTDAEEDRSYCECLQSF